MKTKSLIFILILIANFSFGQEFTDLYGDYLGQTPPGDTAVIFAPGVVSTDIRQHSAPAFSPDGNEVYWMVQRLPTSSDPNYHYYGMGMRRINNRWTVPDRCDLFESGPAFSKKGLTLPIAAKLSTYRASTCSIVSATSRTAKPIPRNCGSTTTRAIFFTSRFSRR